MFFSSAWAQGAGAATPASPGALEALLPIILIFVVFYFLLFRPQQKKMKQHREMLTALRRGDRIVTGGGIVGTITKVVDDNEVQIEIAEGVRVRVQRALISAVLAKTEPASAESTRRDDEKGGDKTPAAASGGEAAPKSDKRVSLLKRALGGKSE
jgi:preprotein translocase subunit YajC